GGILRNGPLQWWEYPLLRLAGKKLIASPYGGDIAVSSYLGDLEEILLRDYPDIPTASPLLKRRILYTLKWADVSVHTYLPGFQPTHNAVWLNMLAIDVDMWQDASKQSTSDGHNRDVVIVHAPNHRHIKGTHHLEEAVSELIGEGLKIDLQILERRSNEEVRAAVLASDIVADQFVFSYGLFAVEGMAAGKPVLGNLSRIPDEFRGNESLEACPIVDTRPEMLRDDLRRLLTNPALRRELGEAGREFVLRYHSYDPVGRAFEALVEYAWNGKPLPKWLAPR
ncbi:MAG: glycosyltransferase family protein, partial [Acidimicrobiia bacterium]